MYREEVSFSTIVEEEWKKTMETILIDLGLKDIYNADETGFFLQVIPR
jgi:hypothetical protein